MTIALEDYPVTSPADESPMISGEPEFVCLTCGTALEYGGRGRKPKYCDEHKRQRSSSTRNTIPSGNNDKLASMAVDVLCQANALMGMGLMLGKMNKTASALADRDDAFRIQAYEALKTDPALCKMILKSGATSGKVALVISYLLLILSVAPVAVDEFKERRDEKARRDEEMREMAQAA